MPTVTRPLGLFDSRSRLGIVLNEIELDTLEEAGYTYELWKISPATGEHVSIAHSGNSRRSDAIEVPLHRAERHLAF